MKISHEPAMVSAVVTAALALLVGYGILDEHRAGLWSALAVAVLPLAQGWVTRSLVVPLSKLREEGRRVPQRVYVREDEEWKPIPMDDPRAVRALRDMGERP